MKEQLLKRKMSFIWLLAAAALVVLDRLTKLYISTYMPYKEPVNIIKFGDVEVLNIFYCLNDGAAFSKFSGQRVLLIVFTAAVILAVLIYMFSGKLKNNVQIAAFGLVLGGGVGNLIDRVFNNGLVIDFIDFRIINFPVFNVADICAVCGALLFAVTIFAGEIREYKKKKAKPSENGGSDGKA